MKRVILDTDIGTDVDDALALVLAAGSPELQIDAVTTVHADAPLRARIARRLLLLAGREDIPVVAGASLPLQLPLPEAFHWQPRLWGHEGVGILGEAELSQSDDLESCRDDAARFIVDHVTAHPGGVSLITIGPLTNVGRALELRPGIANLIRDLTVMGGLVDDTKLDWPPQMETNLNADPKAAQIVLDSTIPTTLIPLEVTTQTYLTGAQREEVRSWNTPLSAALSALMDGMMDNFDLFAERVGLPEGIFRERTLLIDPIAIYAAMACRLIDVRRQSVRLEVRNRVLRTMREPAGTPNMNVCVDVDVDGFVDFWIDRVKRIASRSCCHEPGKK